MAEIYGVSDGSTETINGSTQSDTIYGGSEESPLDNTGDDSIYGKQGNDVIYGGDGDDKLYGEQGSDSLYGGDGNDELYGGNGDDLLVGGTGDDQLSGGNGDDTFEFDFSLSQSESAGGTPMSFAAWLEDAGLTLGALTQSQFATEYGGWLNYLVEGTDEFVGLKARFELDGGEDGIVTCGLNQNDPNGNPYIEGLSEAQLADVFGDAASIQVKTGKTSQERWYSDLDANFAWSEGEDVLGSGDGFDTIIDFGNGANVLRLEIAAPDGWTDGMTSAEAIDYVQQFFTVAQLDANDNGTTDTVISLGDEWSVTLDGYTTADIWAKVDLVVNGEALLA